MPGLPVDPDDELVDVSKLFPEAKKSSPSPQPIVPGGDSYDLEEEAEEVPIPWARAPIAEPKRPAKPKPAIEPAPSFEPEPSPDPEIRTPRRPAKVVAKPTPDEFEEDDEDSEEATVEEIWTRWGEWGTNLIQLAVGFVGVIFVTYLAGAYIGFGTAFLALVLGMAALVPLVYPIAVTLERPVRMTPERAIKDFYDSAAHHFPQYRRMWLLLSDEGKQSRDFDSFATFRTYWKHRITQIRGAAVNSTTPLNFAILDFDADKSLGQTEVDAKYTVSVRPRGEDGRVLEEVRIKTSLVKGPDKMWYLNSGTL